MILRPAHDERESGLGDGGMAVPLGQAVVMVVGGGQAMLLVVVRRWVAEQGREFRVSVRPGYTTYLGLLFRR